MKKGEYRGKYVIKKTIEDMTPVGVWTGGKEKNIPGGMRCEKVASKKWIDGVFGV